MNNIINEKKTDNNLNTPNGNISPSIDYIFFIRRKKSFRYLIFSLVILTLCLWFSDRYLRFDLDETKYRIALTLEKESARPIMRNIAAKVTSNPTLFDDTRYSQYLEFLASIEEDDEVIKLYQKVYDTGNINSSFLSNYAIKLYFHGEYEKAKDLIKEAQNLPPNNSLLGYLESAMVIISLTIDEKTFADGISIIAKENRSGNPVIFPEPFWHDTLPKYTYSYYLQKTNALDHYLTPLYKLSSNILNKIEKDLNENNIHNIQVWLEELFLMGKKIGTGIKLNNSYANLPICIFSLKLQKDAISLYNKFPKMIHSQILEEEKNKLSLIIKLLEACEKLENKRKIELEHKRANRTKIIGFMFLAFFELLIIYLIIKVFIYLLSKLQSNSFSFQYSGSIYFLGLIWAITIFIILLFSLYLNEIINKDIYTIFSLWSFLIVSPFIAVFFAPFSKKTQINVLFEQNDNIDSSQLKYRYFILNFIEKISGILLGYYVILICILFLSFRIIYDSYPFQLNLIRDPMRIEEFNLIKDFILCIHS